MASLDGNLLCPIEYSDQYAYAQNRPPPDHTEVWESSTSLAGMASRTQPVTELAQSRIGSRLDNFGELDWYNRIHIEPLAIDLGNIISTQQRTIKVWNAFFVAHTLNDVVPFNDAGLVLSEPYPTPIIFAPLLQLNYLLNVSTEGPATVDATYTFDWDIEDFTVTVIGVRIVGWPFDANWINPVLERLEWNTNIIPAYDKSEQRRQIREFPRWEWEFTFDVKDQSRRLFENLLYGWGARIWALPIWTDAALLTEDLLAGATLIELEQTAGRDYHVGGIGLILSKDGSFESFEISVVNATSIELQSGLASSWPAGSKVFPARTARLIDPRASGHEHRNYARGSARFRSTEEIERAALEETTTYRGAPVMTVEANWREALEIDYTRAIDIFDPGYGRDSQTDEARLALPVHSFLWTMLSRADVDYFRAWLYARRGRARGVWIPTWSDDLVIVDTVGDTQQNINVEACGLTYYAKADVHRRDVRIQLRDGTVFYRRVSAPVVVDAHTERLTLDTSLGQTLEPEDFERLSWMHYVRLDSDSIELSWDSPDAAEAKLVMKGPRNDI
jgi:hypothetical protein